MPNFPKPPKLYYYLAELVVFIILCCLSVFAYWRIGENLNQTYKTYPIYKNINQNLVKSTWVNEFIDDKNNLVVNFEDCNTSLKVRELSHFKIFSKTLTLDDKSKVVGLFISADLSKDSRLERVSEKIICTKNKVLTTESTSTSDRIINFTEDLGSQLERSLGIDTSDAFNERPRKHFSSGERDGYYYDYKIFPWSKDDSNAIITSIQSDIVTDSKYKYMDIVDLDKVANNQFLNQSNLGQNKNIVAIGCDKNLQENLDYNICKIWNRQKGIFFDLKDFDREFVFEGKSYMDNQFLIFKSSDNCKDRYKVYNYNTESNQLNDLNIGIDFKYCIAIEQGTLLEVNCPTSDIGPDAKKCFKKDSDYQTYIKEYNEEQAKNKATEAELAKYLE